MNLPQVSDRYSAEDVRRFYAEGRWQRDTFWDEVRRRAGERPEKVFLSDATTTLTYGRLHDDGLKVASALRALGIRKGDRVLMQLPNWTEFGLVAAALTRIGAILVPVMTIYRHDDVRYVAEHSGARLAVTTGEFRGFDYLAMHRRLAQDCASLETVISVRTPPIDGVTSLEEITAGAPADDSALGEGPGPDDGLIIIYTSGTTARPKGCFHTWNTMSYSARVMARQLGWSGDDVAFGPSPIGHGTGYNVSLVGPLLTGGTSHLMEAWEPAEALRRIREHGCTTATTAASFLQMMLDVYDPALHDASGMRVWVAAGSPIPPAVVDQSRRMLGGCEILSLYGRSENFLTTMCSIGEDPARITSSDGRAVDAIEVRIVDAEGLPLPALEPGDIAYRGPGHMLGYFRDPDQTALLYTPDGFSRSGDLGYMDADGYVRVTGRIKDIIIRGGLNISAREIEDHLLEHPAITSVAVVAMPDERLGERACAYVVLRRDATLTFEEMSRFLAEREIAIQKRPERLEIVEALPMTASGKVQKHVLRADIVSRLRAEREQGTP